MAFEQIYFEEKQRWYECFRRDMYSHQSGHTSKVAILQIIICLL